MKKIRKTLSRLLALTLALSLTCFTATAGDQVPTVIFDGSAEEFRFENVEVFEHTDRDAHEHPQNVDLFRDMKNIFPGDVYAETIKVKTVNLGSKDAKLYLRAENPNEDFETLMGAGNEAAPVLWVQCGDVVYNAKLGEGIELGEFTRDHEIELTVMLQFPLEAGNELQGLIAEIDWVFTAEVFSNNSGGGGGGGEIPKDPPVEIPDEPVPLDPAPVDPPVVFPEDDEPMEMPEEPLPAAPPKTGDISMLWLVLAALSGAGLVFLKMTEKKKEEEA